MQPAIPRSEQSAPRRRPWRQVWVSLPISMLVGFFTAGLVQQLWVSTATIGGQTVRVLNLRYPNVVGWSVLLAVVLVWQAALWPGDFRRLIGKCVRFRLRTLFALVTASAVLTAAVVVPWFDEHRQRTAVGILGASAKFEGRHAVALEWSVPADDLLDERLAELKRLPHLRRVSLRFQWLTDAGLSHLANLPKLDELHFGPTKHFDRRLDLVKLFGPSYQGLDVTSEAGFWRIRNDLASGMLMIRNTFITDDGMAQLAKIRSLQVLDLSDTAVADKGLAVLAELPRLEDLDLRRTYVTDAGLKWLPDFPALARLRLGGTRYVTNDGLKHVARMPKLRELRLCYSIDDKGVPFLFPLKGRIERVDVSETQITADGIAALQAALPDCFVDTLGDR